MKKMNCFYTIDSEYLRFNGMKCRILKVAHQGKEEGDSLYEVELENGELFWAFGDELNGFIREHENDPIYLPVVWENVGRVAIPGDKVATIAEAKAFFEERYDEIKLPRGEYLEDSLHLSADDLEDIARENYPFRNPARQRNVPIRRKPEIGGSFGRLSDKKKNREGVCPQCGNTELEYGAGELTERSFKYPWICKICGAEGTEWYDLVFSEQVLD